MPTIGGVGRSECATRTNLMKVARKSATVSLENLSQTLLKLSRFVVVTNQLMAATSCVANVFVYRLTIFYILFIFPHLASKRT